MIITGWHYSFDVIADGEPSGITHKEGNMCGPGLDTEEKAREDLVKRWGKAAEKAKLRRSGDV